MDDADLSALLDELGSDGSEDESAFERTLDDILGEDGDSEDLWTIDPQPTKEVSKVVKVQPIKELTPRHSGEELERAARSPAKSASDGGSVKSGRGIMPVQSISPPKHVPLASPPGKKLASSVPETKRAAEKSSPELPVADQRSTQQLAQETGEGFGLRPSVLAEASHSEASVKTAAVRGQEAFPKSPPSEVKKRDSSNERVVQNGVESSSKPQVLAKQRSDAGKRSEAAVREEGEKGAVPGPAPKVAVNHEEPQQNEVLEPHRVQESHSAAPQPNGAENTDLARAEVEAKLKLRERDLERLLEDSVQEVGAGAPVDEKSAGEASEGETKGLENSEVAPEEHLDRQPSALQIAEELERLRSSSGAHLEEGAAAQPMQLEGAWAGPPAIGVLRVEEVEALSAALGTPTMKRDHGEPQALALHPSFIAVGLSRGGVLMAPGKPSKDSAHQNQSKAFVLGGGGHVACCALDVHLSGELLLAGYADGTLILWDVQRATPARASFGVGPDEHAAGCPITHVRFLAALPDQPRISRAVTADAKGIVMLHIFSSVPILRRYTVTSQRLLDGSQAIGPVLDLKPLITSEPSHPPPTLSLPAGVNAHQNEPRGVLTPRTSYSEVGAPSPKPAGTPPGERSVGRFDKGLDMGRKVLVDAGLDKSLDMGRKFLFDAVNTAADAGKVIAGAGSVKGVAEDLIEKGLVAMLTGSTILVALLAEKMQVLVRMPRPESVRDGAVPYCAWRKPHHWPAFQTPDTPPRVSESSSDPATSPAPEAPKVSTLEEDRLRRPPLLAVGWDRTVLICRLGRGGLRILSRWQLQGDADVTGITWLGDDVLGVLTGREEMCVYWVTTGEEIERFMIGVTGGEEAAVSHSHYTSSAGSPVKAYHNSVAARGPAMFVLGPSALKVGRLLHWKERLEGLRQAGDWVGAFHAAMELYDGKAKGVLGVPPSLPALHEAIMPTLLSLLAAYIDEAMAYVGLSLGTSKGEPEEQSEGVAQYSGVGGVAIEFCVHIGRPEVLFEDVFDKFTAVGHQGTFLELLEPYILKDTLRGLAPAVMQALVEHYSVKGWLQRVEQCVLHMNIASLDFNQVVRLCRQHMLYSALIYVFSSGLDDFVTPLEELLAVARDTQSAHARAFGYKLLVYLKHCFLGLAFPPGNGPLDPGRLPSLRSELINFLCASEASGHVSGASNDVSKAEANGRTGEGDSVEKETRFARLRYLLGLDTEAALRVLSAAFPESGPLAIGRFGEGFQGDRGEVTEPTDEVRDQVGDNGELKSAEMAERVLSNDEASTSSPGKLRLRKVGARLGKRFLNGVGSWRGGVDSPGGPPPGHGEAPVDIVAGGEDSAQNERTEAGASSDGDALVQMVVDALIEICRSEEGGLSSSVRDGSVNSSPGRASKADTASQMFEFCARFIATGHAVVSPSVLDWLIRRLCGARGKSPGASDKHGSRANPRANPAKHARADSSEAVVVSLLKGALGLPKPLGTLTGFDAEGLLVLTDGLGFWHAAALLHAAQGRFAAALDSLLKDPSLAEEAFAFVSKYLSGDPSEGVQADAVRSAVLARLPALVRLDANAAACIVADHLASDNDRVLKALGSFPDLQFAYLKGIVTAQAVTVAPGVGGPGTSKLGDLLQRAGIEVTDEMAELYVGLMCRFEPGSVLPFLESHQAYRLEQCLALCQRFGVTDASAYLLERMGDVGAALNLVLSQVTAKMSALDAAVAARFSGAHTDDFLEGDLPDLSDLPELPAAEKALEVAVALCQRNTQRMDPRETEALWFRLVRQYMEPLRGLKEGAARGGVKGTSAKGGGDYPAFQREKGSDGVNGHGPNGRKSTGGLKGGTGRGEGGALQCAGNPPAARALRRVLARFISAIMYAMMGHVPLGTILNKILQDHGGDEFGDFKGTILGMLGTFGYEREILRTARDLIEDDTWQSLDQLKRLRSHGLAPNRATCCVCERQLSEKPPQGGGSEDGQNAGGTSVPTSKAPPRKKRNPSQEKLPALRVFVCGHVAHAACAEAGGLDCPVCGPPGKVELSDAHDKGKRPLVEENESSSGGGLGGGLGILTRGVQPQNSPSQRSRLALLRDLDRGNDFYGRSEGLQLAPPPVAQTPSYVERKPGRLPRRAVYSSSAHGLGSASTRYSSPIEEDDLT